MVVRPHPPYLAALLDDDDVLLPPRRARAKCSLRALLSCQVRASAICVLTYLPPNNVTHAKVQDDDLVAQIRGSSASPHPLLEFRCLVQEAVE